LEEKPFFKRYIEISVIDDGDRLRIKGSLKDCRFGDTLHEIDAFIIINPWDGEIKEINGHMKTLPLEECVKGLETLKELVGVSIKPGFTDIVKNTVGSSRGCTHLATLVTNMGNVSVQGRSAYSRMKITDENTRLNIIRSNVKNLGLINSCVSWREDGPIVRKLRRQIQD